MALPVLRQHARMRRRDVFDVLVAAVPWLGGAPVWAAGSARASDDDALATRLRAGRVAVLLRHATTDPGVGDPPGFRPGDCSTQRNLSAEGRTQAAQIGAWFRVRGLVPSRVRSSAWCRCLDTGTLAFGRAESWAALNSFFGDGTVRERQSALLADAVGQIEARRFEVWITHQINITAVTEAFAEMGEGVVVAPAAGSPSKAVQVVARSRFGG
jgi:phosphohistidine phosphatase SixA